MNVQNVARAGVTAALLAVSAWISLAIGPVPFTLQTMVLSLIPAALNRRTAVLAVGCYLLLGAIGLPVFAGFGSGLGTLAGPTGGFLWGFLIGVAVATTMMQQLPTTMPALARVIAADLVMLAITYTCGTVQLMVVASLSLPAALAAAVFPFMAPEAIKLFVGATTGLAVARAIGHSEPVRA